MPTLFEAGLLLIVGLQVNAQKQTGYCNTQPAFITNANDVRCSRHNYTDFRDTHRLDLYGQDVNDGRICYLTECDLPHKCMKRICDANMTRECLAECVRNFTVSKQNINYPMIPCIYLPTQATAAFKLPTIYTLRISDELFLQNQILARKWRMNREPNLPQKFFTVVNASYNYILSGRGNKTHCVEIEKSMDWCNDQSEERMYNGTYVLCREEKDIWRVMAEFGNRATHCIRYYIQKNFMKQKGSADFQKDMRGICATLETELHNNPELAKTHTTQRHSVEVNTYNACCFLMKSRLIENFNCTGESTTRYPNTPAPTVEHELRIESELKVYDDILLSSAITSRTIVLFISVFVLFHKC